ncbi:MAG: phospholipase D-like domain-containing protein [Anaerolineales bacterium]|nr:phospholipase D-like domain-containing protein [Anaerolineales bacterium]
MRVQASGEVTVLAVAGTHVVLFGMDMHPADTNGLLGFAIQREELAPGGNREWLRGSKSFPSQQSTTAFTSLRSVEAPFQAFQWADYTVYPGKQYRYLVFPMKGQPGSLHPGNPTEIELTTESPAGSDHSIYFNRGAVASQAYSRKFGLNPPEGVGQEAFDWLARDLLPGMLAFIERAADDRFSLHAAIYETRYEPVLEAFRAAHLRDARVRLIYDGRPAEIDRNLKVIREARIKGLTKPRANGKIMHNKFIVLSKNNSPVAVWTGSTNLSNNAFFGQLNVGHAIEDEDLARAFLDYWHQLEDDPTRAELRQWAEANNPFPPPANDDRPLVEIFAPQSGSDEFRWFIDLANTAQQALFMTFPFGIVKDFRPIFNQNDQVLRFALLDKYVNGGNAVSRKAAKAEITAARQHPNIGMTVGSRIFLENIDGWLLESRGIGTFVNWVHTKFMLIDPLGPAPVTVTGSANWSAPGLNANDENLVLIRGNTRVADIYLTEFMRIFSHHRFRESLRFQLENQGSLSGWRPRDLDESDSWLGQHYDSSEERFFRRRYFSGQ